MSGHRFDKSSIQTKTAGIVHEAKRAVARAFGERPSWD